MKVPIPDDWNGEDWFCVQIQWPDSPMWIALLTGFLSLPSYGYYWDERSGSIRGVQAIGRELFDRNFPYVPCVSCEDVGQPPDVDKVFLGEYLTIMERVFQMSLCGYNPKAFKIVGGVLYVRDFCGDWVPIGSLMDGGEDIPDDPPIDPPPGNLGDSTACAKALKLSVVCHNIVNVAFNAGSLDVDFVWGWYDFADYVRNAFPTINFGDEDLYNLFYLIVAVETAGLESETEAIEISQTLACRWEPLFEDGAPGITADQYEQSKTVLSSVLRDLVGDDAHLGFGLSMRHIWERVLSSIGPNDAKKITTDLVTTGLEDCSCPEAVDPPVTDPLASGWYLGAGIDLGLVSADDDRYNEPEGTFDHCWEPGKHIYGVAVEYAVVNAIAMKDFGLGGELVCTADVELTEYVGPVDYTDSSKVIFVFDNVLSAELYAEWGTPRGVAYREDIGVWSSTVNTPAVSTSQVAGVSGSGLANVGETVQFTVTVYPIHNSLDDSHA